MSASIRWKSRRKPRKSLERVERQANLFADCYDDPSLFNDAILGRSPYWGKQNEICDSVARYRDTLVASGNAVGKSYVAAGVALWWYYTRPRSLVVTTAASQTLLGTVLWKEMRRAKSRSIIPLDGEITVSPKASPQTLDLGDGWCVLGISTKTVERLSGQHAADLLVIVDEASGVDDEIWEAIDSLNYNRMLAIGNPIRADGRFFDLWQQSQREKADGTKEGDRVNAITISSLDSPHAHLDRSPVGLADGAWLAAMRRRYGEQSLWWKTHVLALFPEISEDSLIPLAWLDAAACVVRDRETRGQIVAGGARMAVDLGEGVGRDRTVILIRDDHGVLEVVAGSHLGLAEAAAEMKRLSITWKIPVTRITYDGAGIGRDLRLHLERVGLKGAKPYHGSGAVKTDFANLRSQSAWSLRRRLDPTNPDNATRPAFAIPFTDWWPTMRDDLKELKYELVNRKTKLENKEDLCARLGRSPDFGDALIQSFAY